MKIHRVALFPLLTLSFALADDVEKKVVMKGVSKVEQMIGHLNKPYGSVVNVTGRVKLVPPVKVRMKGSQERYFVVTHIEGRKLEQAITFDLWSENLPNAKDGDVVTAKAYERLMMFGTPKDVPDERMLQGSSKDLEFRLWQYLHVLPE